jgi:uncharacterized RDD family membrane protein YckC
MEPKIDFSSYTLDELYSSAEAIDRVKYPERAQEIDRLINEQLINEQLRKKPEKVIEEQLVKEQPLEKPIEQFQEISIEQSIEQPEEQQKEQAQEQEIYVDNIKRVGDKATRMDRFLAAAIDGLIGVLVSIPIFIYIDFEKLSEPTFTMSISLLAYGLLASIILNGYLIFHYGQTIGKNFMSIRIENLDDSKASFSTIYLKRMIPMQIFSLIPVVGAFVSGIVNLSFIFGKEKRCLHDYIAETKVCYTNN